MLQGSLALRHMGLITNNIREAAARVKDFFYCIEKPEPTYLGEEIPIKTASASLTDDKIKV